MENEVPRKMSDWQPMRNPKDIAVLGKLGEELGELVAALNRCLIQGIDEKEPVTDKPNRQWLTEELADVRALCNLASDHFKLDETEMRKRTGRKYREKVNWLAMVWPLEAL